MNHRDHWPSYDDNRLHRACIGPDKLARLWGVSGERDGKESARNRHLL
jgi:hypothetical protein